MSILGRVNLGSSTTRTAILVAAILALGACLASWPLACAVEHLAKAIQRR